MPPRRPELEDRIAKLPRWAQTEIGRLRRDLEQANARLADGPATSNTFADPYSDAPRPLGRDTLIAFQAGDDPHRDRFRVQLERQPDGSRELYVSGDDSLQVQPWASNVVKLRIRRL